MDVVNVWIHKCVKISINLNCHLQNSSEKQADRVAISCTNKRLCVRKNVPLFSKQSNFYENKQFLNGEKEYILGYTEMESNFALNWILQMFYDLCATLK